MVLFTQLSMLMEPCGISTYCTTILEVAAQKGYFPNDKAKKAWIKLVTEPNKKHVNLNAIANMHAGLTVKEVRRRAREAFRANPAKAFKEQISLIKWLKSKGVKIYVITASYKLAVEPALKQLGLSGRDVIGVENVTRDGLIQKGLKNDIPIYEGKRNVLDKVIKGDVIFAAGNTPFDEDLLRMSKIKLACSSKPCCNQGLVPLENKLKKEARRHGWNTYTFKT